MEFAGFALIAFAPGAFWLWFFARKDVYRPEPKRLLALAFFLGVVSAVPAAAIEYVFIADSDFAGMAFGTLAANMLFVVGPVFDWARRVSQFHYRRSYPKIACAACGRRIAAISRFRRARAAGRRRAAALYCGRCAAPSRPDAAYRAACGDKFVL